MLAQAFHLAILLPHKCGGERFRFPVLLIADDGDATPHSPGFINRVPSVPGFGAMGCQFGGIPFRLLLPHSLACFPFFGAQKVFAERFSEGVPGFPRIRISSKLSQTLTGAHVQHKNPHPTGNRPQASQT